MPMQVDVIIPTYNRAQELRRAIESVLKQSDTRFNLYVVDDGSTDETREVVNHYPGVHYLYQKNKGVSSARNFGVKNSNSPFIAFLDSDDEWLSHKLERQLNYLKDNPACEFIHSEEIWIRNGVRVNPKVKHKKSNDNLFERSLDFCLISPSTTMIKRELFLSLGMFDEEFIVCEDYDLWLKVLVNKDIGFINEALIIKNGGHPDQLSTQFPAMDYWRIKSLVNLLLKNELSSTQEEQIKDVIRKKSAILLPGFLKHNNQKSFDEITSLLKSVMLH